MSSSIEPLHLSVGYMRLRLNARMASAAAAAGGGGGGDGRNPHLSVYFHLISPAGDHTTRSEHLYFNPPFSSLMDRRAWAREVNSMIACVVARVRSVDHNFLLRAFTAYSNSAINRFLMLSGHAGLLLSAEVEMTAPPRHFIRAAVETPRWRENLVTVTFEGNEHGEEEECAICLMGFVAADELHVMPCRHRFHSVCLRKWLRRHCTCPMCRFSLPLAGYK